MFTKKTKRYLMLLAALGLIAIAAGSSGTFAGFNAEVANTGNTFQTGTLFLHDKGGVNTCTSESDANNQNIAGTGCDVLFTTPVITPGSTYPADLTLSNAGTLNASDIQFALGSTGCVDSKPSVGTLSSGLTNGTPPASLVFATLSQDLLDGTQIELQEGTSPVHTHTYTVSGDHTAGSNVTVSLASPDDPGFSFTTAAHVSLAAFGTALCSQLKITIQEYTSAARTTPVSSTCAFPASTSATCGTPTVDLADAQFASLQPLQLGSATAGNTLSQLSAKKSRYFRIFILAPASLANSAQNDEASFDLLWHIDQV
jgi:hypothetical protein